MNPLLLPELLALVAKQVQALDAAPCCLVCRAWNHAFSPVLWRRFCIRDSTFTNEHTIQGLYKNALLVQDLRYEGLGFVTRLPLLPCTQLTGLFVYSNRLSPRPVMAGHWDELSRLVKSQHHLRKVSINGYHEQATAEFWRSLTSCTHFTLRSVSLTKEHVRALWEGLRNVQELETCNIHLINTDLFYGEAQGLYLHLKRLVFYTEYDSNAEALFLTKCPNLSELTLAYTIPGQHHALSTLTDVLAQGLLPQLVTLTVTFTAEDHELAACLRAMTITSAQGLNFSSTEFGSLAFLALTRHFASLYTLEWRDCPQVTGTMIQTVVESCPALRVFAATTIKARLIQKGRPWVCLRLRALVLCVVVEGRAEVETEAQVQWDEEDEDAPCEQSRAVFEQLAHLTELVTLTIGPQRHLGPPAPMQGLDLRLVSGLDLLSSLKELRMLDHKGTEQNMGTEDFDWMKANLSKCENYGRW